MWGQTNEAALIRRLSRFRVHRVVIVEKTKIDQLPKQLHFVGHAQLVEEFTAMLRCRLDGDPEFIPLPGDFFAKIRTD